MMEINQNLPAQNVENTHFSITPNNFTEPEAAQWLKVSRITLQRARIRGEIAFCRIGGIRVIYTRKHLEDYLKSREHAAFAPSRKRQTKLSA